VDGVSKAADLQLDSRGRLPGGFRYTVTGLQAVCRAASPGLYQLVTELAGCNRDAAKDPRDDYSFPEAIEIFNRVIARRFDHRFLDKQRVVRDGRTKLVEGLVGPKYSIVENIDFFERATDAASQVTNMPLSEAVLAGRRLILRFAAPKPLFSLAVPDANVPEFGRGADAFHAGLHFLNSEIGGDASLRAAVMLRRAADGTASLGRWLGGRRVHTGRELMRRVAMVFSEAASVEQDADRLRVRMLALRSESLGLKAAGPDARIERLRAIMSWLQAQAIQARVAERAVVDALYRGAYGVPGAVPAAPDEIGPSSRTAFDLYIALTTQGQDLYVTGRETTEQVAYRMLLGRIKLK
jgi:hypothetical protein